VPVFRCRHICILCGYGGIFLCGCGRFKKRSGANSDCRLTAWRDAVKVAACCLPAISLFRHWPAFTLLTVLVSGCATHVVPPAPIVEAMPAAEPEESLLIPVVRQGRYTLAELAPTAAQRDLLLQVVDMTLPQGVQATVGDGLRHVLKRSGWRLCGGTAAVTELDALPLPAAHRVVGPMMLRDALLTLAGSAWELRVDERARRVCFVVLDDAPDDAQDVEAVQTFPLAGAQP